jgi:transcriptional regulator with XRE-family HTH domain
MSTKATNGADLKQMREMCGLSQYALSMITGIARNRISLAECGYLTLRGEELATIHEALRKTSESKTVELTTAFSESEPVAASA